MLSWAYDNDSDDVIPESVSKLNKMVSCGDTNSDSSKFVLFGFFFFSILDLVFIMNFLSVNN